MDQKTKNEICALAGTHAQGLLYKSHDAHIPPRCVVVSFDFLGFFLFKASNLFRAQLDAQLDPTCVSVLSELFAFSTDTQGIATHLCFARRPRARAGVCSTRPRELSSQCQLLFLFPRVLRRL
jgi:hypothetical protein